MEFFMDKSVEKSTEKRIKHCNVENEFWFSTSFSLPIGRRTLCRKAKTLFGFWFSTSRLDRPKLGGKKPGG